jgi:hypothetical protein
LLIGVLFLESRIFQVFFVRAALRRHKLSYRHFYS